MTHGHRLTNAKRSPTYLSWVAMKQRCLNCNHDSFMDYGGRGITIQPSWMDFRNFLFDMGMRPKGKTLDRKDVNGNYTKDNCKWSTIKTQNRNRRNCARYCIAG